MSGGLKVGRKEGLELLAEWEKSGEPLQSWCDTRGLNRHTLSNYKGGRRTIEGSRKVKREEAIELLAEWEEEHEKTGVPFGRWCKTRGLNWQSLSNYKGHTTRAKNAGVKPSDKPMAFTEIVLKKEDVPTSTLDEWEKESNRKKGQELLAEWESEATGEPLGTWLDKRALKRSALPTQETPAKPAFAEVMVKKEVAEVMVEKGFAEIVVEQEVVEQDVIHPVSRYRLTIDGIVIDVDDNFRDDTLRRLVGLLKS